MTIKIWQHWKCEKHEASPEVNYYLGYSRADSDAAFIRYTRVSVDKVPEEVLKRWCYMLPEKVVLESGTHEVKVVTIYDTWPGI